MDKMIASVLHRRQIPMYNFCACRSSCGTSTRNKRGLGQRQGSITSTKGLLGLHCPPDEPIAVGYSIFPSLPMLIVNLTGVVFREPFTLHFLIYVLVSLAIGWAFFIICTPLPFSTIHCRCYPGPIDVATHLSDDTERWRSCGFKFVYGGRASSR
ncbi:hypothetical protein ABW19_dt0207375 [Dactylella cylindrospora]|nr:hypothetical protein ABW19_dt0207375 [Dactylella cylindrospora]